MAALEPGRYVVAVSGGVDSVVLLHILCGQKDLNLIVAHFDHGIRADSGADEAFVRGLAARYGLSYVYDRARLGPQASEAAARQARYGFLHKARAGAAAQAVVTAHHQDDVLETAILNIIRGTGRRGLTSLRSTDIVKRPLLHVPKADIVAYARKNGLTWHEDSTNASDSYRRNYIRHNILSRFTPVEREKLHKIIVTMRGSNTELDMLLGQLLKSHMKEGRVDRTWFVMLPHAVAREVMAQWLRTRDIPDIDRKMLERLVHAAKTFTAGRRVSVTMDWSLVVNKSDLALQRIER